MKHALACIVTVSLAGGVYTREAGAYDLTVFGKDGIVPAENPTASYLVVSGKDGIVPAENPTASYLVQNIFDDDAADTAAEKPVAEKPAKKASDEGEKSKPAAKGSKKKRRGKKKKKVAVATSEPARSGYSTAEVARASYEWAPESEPVTLLSTAPGIKAGAEAPAVKPAAAVVKSEPIETKPAPQGFKLPQIPLAQVLIVAGFVLLFLIYRFRVGKQIKRKKY